jgi:type VI protein secretion system component VasK
MTYLVWLFPTAILTVALCTVGTLTLAVLFPVPSSRADEAKFRAFKRVRLTVYALLTALQTALIIARGATHARAEHSGATPPDASEGAAVDVAGWTVAAVYAGTLVGCLCLCVRECWCDWWAVWL